MFTIQQRQLPSSDLRFVAVTQKYINTINNDNNNNNNYCYYYYRRRRRLHHHCHLYAFIHPLGFIYINFNSPQWAAKIEIIVKNR